MDQGIGDLNKYIAYLRDIKKFSPHTIRAYTIDIRQFLDYFSQQRLEPTKGNVRAFIAHVFSRGRNKATTARKIYAVRSFYGFLVKSGALAHNPLEGLSTPKQERRIPRILSESECRNFSTPWRRNVSCNCATRPCLSFFTPPDCACRS